MGCSPWGRRSRTRLSDFTGWRSLVGCSPWGRRSRTRLSDFAGWRSLVGCSPWGRKEPDTTERLHFHFHFLLRIRGFRGCGVQALAPGLSSCGSQPWLPCGTWDLLGPGIEPVSLALGGGFLIPGPPGRPPQTPSALEQAAAGLLFSRPVVSAMGLASGHTYSGLFFPICKYWVFA